MNWNIFAKSKAFAQKVSNWLITFLKREQKFFFVIFCSRYIQTTASQHTSKKKLAQEFLQAQQCEQAEEWKLHAQYVTPDRAFAAIKDATMLELQCDSFPRFLRSKEWMAYIHCKEPEFVKTLGMYKAATIYKYADSDFEDNVCVTDTDFAFFTTFLQDDYVSSCGSSYFVGMGFAGTCQGFQFICLWILWENESTTTSFMV